jgi:hypothetical protein
VEWTSIQTKQSLASLPFLQASYLTTFTTCIEPERARFHLSSFLFPLYHIVFSFEPLFLFKLFFYPFILPSHLFSSKLSAYLQQWSPKLGERDVPRGGCRKKINHVCSALIDAECSPRASFSCTTTRGPTLRFALRLYSSSSTGRFSSTPLTARTWRQAITISSQR